MVSKHATFSVGDGGVDDACDFFVGEGVEDEDTAAREKSGVHFERWVLSRCADEGDGSVFYNRQDGILLGFVEAVDLVDEEEGAVSALQILFGGVDDFTEVSNACRCCADPLEDHAGFFCDDLGEGGFADAGRSPEDDRAELACFGGDSESGAGCGEVSLTDELVEVARTHARGEWFVGAGCLALGGYWLREELVLFSVQCLVIRC